MAKPDKSDGECVESPHTATRFRKAEVVRYDLLDPDFLTSMARIMAIGAEKYGEYNWQRGLSGEHGGVNHALAHILEYQNGTPNDYGPREYHLAQVAVNAMFEFYFERRRRLEAEKAEQEMLKAELMKKAAEEKLGQLSSVVNAKKHK